MWELGYRRWSGPRFEQSRPVLVLRRGQFVETWQYDNGLPDRSRRERAAIRARRKQERQNRKSARNH